MAPKQTVFVCSVASSISNRTSDTLFRHMRKMIGSIEFRTAYSFVPLGSRQDYMIAILCAGHLGGPPG